MKAYLKNHQLLVVAGILVAVGIVSAVLYHYKQPAKSASTNSSKTPQTASQTAPATQPAPKPATFNKQQYSLDDPTSIWVVVNKQRPLNPVSYAPADLTSIGNGQYMRAAAAGAFSQLVTDAKAAGYSLYPESGYRSYATQTSVYANEVKNYGQSVADSESARPGYSEHQTGWAVDIGSPGCIEDCFGTTAASQWVLTHAAAYGFIQRYQENKASITGYRHEPWHFRYIGTELAQEMAKTGQTTLEEFFGLPPAPTY